MSPVHTASKLELTYISHRGEDEETVIIDCYYYISTAADTQRAKPEQHSVFQKTGL